MVIWSCALESSLELRIVELQVGAEASQPAQGREEEKPVMRAIWGKMLGREDTAGRDGDRGRLLGGGGSMEEEEYPGLDSRESEEGRD